MKDYLLGLDVWEGSLDIDEQELLEAGVTFLAIRLNSTEGGTHKDNNFDRQWAQAEPFYRWPYYVYNPWLSGPDNVEWLGDHIPPGVKRVAIDIEVKRAGYSPAAYAADVRAFVKLAARNWRPAIYTGAWFLPLLSSWPGECDCWWARYPGLMYPDRAQEISWDSLRFLLQELVWDPCPPASKVKTPGAVKVWQCSGDRFKLPGCCGRAVDINVTRMSRAELAAWVEAGPAAVRWEYAITDWARGLGYTGPGPEYEP